MSQHELRLRNENGTWVGYDQDDNKVPVPFESVESEVTNTDEFASPAKDADYNVWMSEGGTVYANGDGGSLLPSHSGGTLNSVMSDVLNSLDPNRTDAATISLNGEFTGMLDEVVINQPHVDLDLYGAYLEWDSGVTGDNWMFYIGKDGSNAHDVSIRGGEISGGSSSGDAIRFFGNWSEGTRQSRIVDLHADNFRRGIFANQRRMSVVRTSVTENSQYGFSPGKTDQNWKYCLAWNNSGLGFKDVASFVHFWQCIAARGGDHGFTTLSGSRGIRWYGGWSENNSGKGIVFDSTATTPSLIKDMGFFNNATTAVDVPTATDLTISDCYFANSSSFSTQTEMVNVGSNGTDVRLRNLVDETDNHSLVDNGTRTLVDGVGQESANAETPSSSWPIGATVDFTDSGDGSGTGVYRKLQDESWVAVA